MHYYQHRLNDHAAKTQHLSLIEEGVLRRLYDLYFETEKPLPHDLTGLCRRVRARTKAEREAVSRMLSEFFTLDGQCWRNAAWDKAIQEYQDGEPERQRRRQNDLERKRRERDARIKLFDALGEHGIVPPGSTRTGELRRLLDAVTRDERDDVTPNTAIHKPLTSNQEPHLLPNKGVVIGIPPSVQENGGGEVDVLNSISNKESVLNTTTGASQKAPSRSAPDINNTASPTSAQLQGESPSFLSSPKAKPRPARNLPPQAHYERAKAEGRLFLTDDDAL